jgi:hypothetical protein
MVYPFHLQFLRPRGSHQPSRSDGGIECRNPILSKYQIEVKLPVKQDLGDDQVDDYWPRTPVFLQVGRDTDRHFTIATGE